MSLPRVEDIPIPLKRTKAHKEASEGQVQRKKAASMDDFKTYMLHGKKSHSVDDFKTIQAQIKAMKVQWEFQRKPVK